MRRTRPRATRRPPGSPLPTAAAAVTVARHAARHPGPSGDGGVRGRREAPPDSPRARPPRPQGTWKGEGGRGARRAPTGHRPDADHRPPTTAPPPEAARGPRRCQPVTHGGPPPRAGRPPPGGPRRAPDSQPHRPPPERGRAQSGGTTDDDRPRRTGPGPATREATGQGERPHDGESRRPSRRTARETRPEDPRRAGSAGRGGGEAVVAGATGGGGGAAEAGRRGRGDRPAGGARPGTPVPRSGERTGAGGAPSSGTRRRRRRRRRHGRRIGAAAGPGSEAHRGTAPGSSRRRGDRGGRTDGEGHRRDAATRGRHHATGGGGGVAARHREGNGPKRPGGGDASRPPGPTAGSHRHRPSRHRGGPAAPPGDDRLAPPPSRGSRPPPPTEPQPTGDRNAGGRTRGTRRGEAGGGGGEGPASTHGGGRGTGTRAPSGDQRKETGHAAGPPGTPARDPTATRTRGRSRDARGAGRPRPSPERGPRPGPAARAGEPSTRLPPSIRDRSVFRLSPEARHPGHNALERGGPDRDRTPPPAAAQGAGAGATGSPSPAAGPGKPRPTGRRTPTRPPFPQGSHHGGAGRTHTAPHLPDARRGPAGPSPDSEGGGAGRGRQRAAHGPTAGPAHPTPSPPTEGGGVLLCPRALAVATVATAHSGGAAAGGSGTPRLPLGSLEKAFSPRARRPSPGPCRLRAHGGAPTSHQSSAGREGSAVQGSGPPRRSVCAVRARAEPASRPLRGLIRQGRPPRRGEQARLSLPPRPPVPRREPLNGTHTPPWRGPEGDTGLRETTPPLGLRHLRDDLERSRGTTEGHARHAHTPAWGAQRGGGGTALPATGRAARRAHAEKAKREQSAVSEDQRPPLTPRGVPVRPSLRTGIWLRCAKGKQKTEPSARRFPRDERAPTRDRARGPDRPRRGIQDGPSRSPPPDWDSESRRGDFDREKARVPGDASGDRTPRGGPHTRLPRSTLGSPPPECDAENTPGRRDPRARTQARPPATSKPPSGPVPTSGAGPRAKHTLLRAAQEESGPPSPSPGAPGREDPLPAHRGGPAQAGSGRSVSAAAGARGHGEMLVDPVRPPRKPAPVRRDGHPPRKPREPISGDSGTVPRPRRHRDCRRQRRRCLRALPRAQRLSHNPPERPRRSSRGEGQYPSGRQVAPDKRLERPEDVSLSPAAGDATAPAAQTPELGPEPPPPSDATRRDPGRRGRERRWEGSPQEAATEETHSPTRFRGAGGDIPRRRRRAVGARRREGHQRHRRLPRKAVSRGHAMTPDVICRDAQW
ncbi:collagen alpha-1(I) chain-like [Budorcas taxicolor]|uniref:collagen alpha-1(I) chain-like n=1 Tax=Budorcas taxicolor TaxID=37181 RepID=UPI0022841F38|nr:collagen alpha-1(I) chain-like [Budorcas taxicolor]